VTRGLPGEARQHIEPGTRRIPVMLEDLVGGGCRDIRGQSPSRNHAGADQQELPSHAVQNTAEQAHVSTDTLGCGTTTGTGA